MAATIHRLRCVRSICCNSWYPIRAFSSGNELPPSFTDNLRSEPGTKQSVASYVKEVKASLKSESPQQTRQTPSRPSTPSEASQPNQVPSFDELRRNLSGFRRSSGSQPSSSGSDQFVSFQELYKKSVMPNPGDSSASSTAVKPSFDAIRESLKRLREKTPPSTQGGSGAREKTPASTQGGSGVSTIYPMSLERLKESLKTRPDQTTGPESPGISSPFSLGSKKLSEDESKNTYMRTYGYPELGEELKKLRPENKKGKWFSLHELNERLVKLKKNESKKLHGLLAGEIRDTLDKLRHSAAETKRVQKVQRLDHLAVFGGTPKYLLSPPKEHLVDKYFHPDNMSSAEKLKLELKQVREEFKMSESDCGSARVQVAQLTTKIKHLAKVLAKKDKHSRKGLQDMVQRRKKLLKYLRRTDWDSYCLVLSKLGLRDKPDLVKA